MNIEKRTILNIQYPINLSNLMQNKMHLDSCGSNKQQAIPKICLQTKNHTTQGQLATLHNQYRINYDFWSKQTQKVSKEINQLWSEVRNKKSKRKHLSENINELQQGKSCNNNNISLPISVIEDIKNLLKYSVYIKKYIDYLEETLQKQQQKFVRNIDQLSLKHQMTLETNDKITKQNLRRSQSKGLAFKRKQKQINKYIREKVLGEIKGCWDQFSSKKYSPNPSETVLKQSISENMPQFFGMSIKKYSKGSQLKLIERKKLSSPQIAGNQLASRIKDIKRTSTAIQIRRKDKNERNKNDLKKEINNLTQKRQKLLNQLQKNSLSYQEIIDQLTGQISTKLQKLTILQQSNDKHQKPQIQKQIESIKYTVKHKSHNDQPRI